MGNFSMNIAKSTPSVKFVGFEPNKELYTHWINQYHNQKSSQIHLENLALGRLKETKNYFTSRDFPATNSLLPRPKENPKGLPYYPVGATLEKTSKVQTISLDEYCSDNNVDKIFLLKLDLQGGELDALTGAQKLLKNNSIAAILAEAMFIRKYENQPLLKDLWSYVERFGFRLHSLYDVQSGDYKNSSSLFRKNQLNQCDALFVSDELATLLED